ncbi:MULE domain-containing protein [Aphis craccivora]|uniref:MULE domain-containing protein n=1 Tax=Aphis craccivora TaxID=307492 RepID=A0A6G0WHW5_APHCR|nr:MULE domain-containing protein [Aphis craccivora]
MNRVREETIRYLGTLHLLLFLISEVGSLVYRILIALISWLMSFITIIQNLMLANLQYPLKFPACAAVYPWKTAETLMRRARKTSLPSIPDNLYDLSVLFENGQLERYSSNNEVRCNNKISPLFEIVQET